MSELTFECPHCGERNHISSDRVGEATACSSCGMPFRTQAPRARLLMQDEEGVWHPFSPHGTNFPKRTEEKVLTTLNPAIYRQHPVMSSILALMTIGGVVGAVYFGSITEGTTQQMLVVSSLVVAVAAVLVLTGWWMVSRFESLMVTNQRSVWARGILNRRTSEVQHDDIRNIQVNQNIVHRFLNVGDVAISSAGQDAMEIEFKGAPSPQEVVEMVREYQKRMLVNDD